MEGIVTVTDGPPEQRPGNDRLDSWKDIAAYLKRDVSTVQRWERHENLPVRRHFHRKTASVYAYRSDINEWWQRRELHIRGTRAEHAADDLPEGSELAAQAALPGHGWRIPAIAVAVALVSAGGLLVVYWPHANTRTPSTAINPAAHEEYLLGRYHMSKQNEADVVRAIDHFEEAAKIAPTYAPAYAALSDAWWVRGIWGGQTLSQVESASRAAAQKALASSPETAQARVSFGRIKYTYDRDWAGAETDFRHALAIDPDSFDAHYFYAMLLMGLGRFPEAIDHIGRAARLDPLSSMIQSGFGRVLYRAREYDQAIDRFHRAIALEPRNFDAFNRLGDAYEMTGRYAEALASYDKARGAGANDRSQTARWARIYARMGRTAEARQMLEDLEGGQDIPPVEAAQVYSALGERDRAFELLFQVVDNPSEAPLILFIKEDPAFDSLHSDARWNALLARLNLADEVEPG
jgi:eukaryotic-like serine/threonine-protein kinase